MLHVRPRRRRRWHLARSTANRSGAAARACDVRVRASRPLPLHAQREIATVDVRPRRAASVRTAARARALPPIRWHIIISGCVVLCGARV